jgi:tetratricopeptide (TPR) repeat protein
MSQAAADELTEAGQELFRQEKYLEAANRFERAVGVFPDHALAWKGLGHSLLCLGRAHDAARAFDRAIGLRPSSATALWGGALAHADTGNKMMAQNYLRRTLALQPTWIQMARDVPQLVAFLQVSSHTADLLRGALGAFSGRTYRHATDEQRTVEVGRLVNSPSFGLWTHVTIGLSNVEWKPAERPRVELIMASTVDTEVCAQILANLAFHLTATKFYPEPGVMVRDVVGALGAGELSQRLPHVYVVVPRGWTVSLPLDVGPPAITLAQIVPVSEAEYQAWRQQGAPKFNAALAQRGVDLRDLRRSGV